VVSIKPNVNKVKYYLYYSERGQKFIHSFKSSTYWIFQGSSHHARQVCLGCYHPSKEEGNKDDTFEFHLAGQELEKTFEHYFIFNWRLFLSLPWPSLDCFVVVVLEFELRALPLLLGRCSTTWATLTDLLDVVIFLIDPHVYGRVGLDLRSLIQDSCVAGMTGMKYQHLAFIGWNGVLVTLAQACLELWPSPRSLPLE
jgi:hypothetical protein